MFMHEVYFFRRVLSFALCVVLFFGVTVWGFGEVAEMTAHFIDQGQADATLLEFPCGAVLIDAGAQDDTYAAGLAAYLDAFFARRADLNKTLAAVYITHTHIDHNSALQAVVNGFVVTRYIDNGMVSSSGRKNANWIRKAKERGDFTGEIIEVSDNQVQASNPAVGLTDGDIDPVDCAECDPEIAILSGRMEENPGWPQEAFKNQNNQSLVIRVDFGEASFLFTGDLEEDALDTLVYYYVDQQKHPEMLDVDVYHVGHHGSRNATTKALVEAMSPDIAVISAGAWDFGKDTTKPFCTWAFGHPRLETVELLKAVDRRRSKAVEPYVFERSKKPVPVKIRKAIYGTPWDGNIQVHARSDGRFVVNVNR